MKPTTRIDALKVGDEVVATGRDVIPWRGRVERITPTGLLLVKFERGFSAHFDRYGHEVRRRPRPLCLQPITPEIARQIDGENARVKLRYFDWERLDDEQAIAVLVAVRGVMEGTS